VSPAFIPGLDLARLFYAEQVRPLLAGYFPGLPHTAALIGWGSEVLGFDSARSTDHNWGPRLQVLVADSADSQLPGEVASALSEQLPASFRGFPTVFPASGAAPESAGHWVTVAPLGSWLTGELGFDPRYGVRLLDWLATPTQRLAEITGGAVFHDGLSGMPGGGLAAARSALAWYPREVWFYVMACQWRRLGQEEAFPGRCAEAGDDLGSALIAARLVRDMIRLVLLIQRRYPPYGKWLGTAFARLPCAVALRPAFAGTLSARTWADRERHLGEAYQLVAGLHNKLEVTPHVDTALRPFHDRPYQILDADRLAAALTSSIASADLRLLLPAGAVDQFVDSTDATADLGVLRAAVAAALGQAGLDPECGT
jgi:hypothetical protein